MHLHQCQLLFFACFLHRRKSISNRVQTPQNFLWIFYGPEDHQWARAAPGVPRGGHNPPGRVWGPRRAQVVVPTLVAWWVVPPSGHPQVQLWPIGGLLVHKKSTKSFAVFGLRLILISCDVKKQGRNNNWHWALVQ